MNETSEVRADTASSDASRGTPSAAQISVGTDAAYAPAAFVHTQRPLRNISEVRHFFRTNEVPIYFVLSICWNFRGRARWRELAAVDQWSQMVIKETSSVVQMITSVAPTGQYSYDRSGALIYRRAALDWHSVHRPAAGRC
jgi:hypothetical protein